MNLKEFIFKLRDILFEGDLDFTELLGVLVYLLSAFWFIAHPGLFEQGKIYNTMAILGNEYLWGGVFLLLALLKLYCIWIDQYRARRRVAAISAGIWVFVLVNFFSNNSEAWMNVFIFVFLFLSVIEYFRHSEKVWMRAQSRKRLNLPEQ